MIYHRINRRSPEVDRNWNVYFATPNHSNLTYQAGNVDSTTRAQFIDSGVLDNSLNQSSKTVKDPNSDTDWPVFSFAVDLGTLSSTSQPDPVLWAIGIVEDSLVTYPLPPSSQVAYYWTKYLDDASVVSRILSPISALNRSLEFDSEIMTAANKISSNYTDILSLVTRQIFASMEITVARNNDNSLDTLKMRIFMKDMGSTNCTSPVDAIYGAFPALLYLNSSRARSLLEPLLELQENSPLPFAFPELGSAYPFVSGDLNYTDTQAVETTEIGCGSMLVMAYAHAAKSADGYLISRYYKTLQRWADYLVKNTLNAPGGSTTMDQLPGSENSNLALKGILGIYSMAMIDAAVGAPDSSYMDNANRLSESWKQSVVTDTRINLSIIQRSRVFRTGDNASLRLGADVALRSSPRFADKLRVLMVMSEPLSTPHRHQQRSRQALHDCQQGEAPMSPRRRQPRPISFSLRPIAPSSDHVPAVTTSRDGPHDLDVFGTPEAPNPWLSYANAATTFKVFACSAESLPVRGTGKGHAQLSSIPGFSIGRCFATANTSIIPATSQPTSSSVSRRRVPAVHWFNRARLPYDDTLPHHDLGRMDVFGLCCNSGKITIPLPADPPSALADLFTSNDSLSVEFRRDLWKYNRAFSFTSLGVNEDHSVNGAGRGEPVFRISGELCHWSGALLPADGHRPRYSQVYLYDPLAALDTRMDLNGSLNHNIIYNLPTVDEVAMILPGGAVAPDQHDIVLRLCGGGLHRNCLRFFEENQSTMRASLYSSLQDAIAQHDDNLDLNSIGQRVVLPSSYVSGPRYMAQCFQDSMALARYFRKVDLFVTMTTNPEWIEIMQELLPGQTAYDCPDLVACVFHLKKNALVDCIYKEGLPHMHLLLFLDEPDKLKTAEDIDACIWARWPDPEVQPCLFEIVKKCMVHGPCGELNPQAPCMQNGKCSKGYPKAFQEFTTADTNGYPLYFRPDDGRKYEVRGCMLDNRSIVAYAPTLSLRFECHINVECAISLGSFKYVFKYIQKGPDLATLEISQPNEIKQYMDGRYISAPVAAWRLAHFEIHEQIPNVICLQVHLPGHHMVTFDPNDSISMIQDISHGSKRIINGSYMNAGPQSFEDLRTFNGIVHKTFHEACLVRGLLEDDGEWKLCLEEASEMQPGRQLRHLFVTILLFCAPSDPKPLWEKFWPKMCDDLPHHLTTIMRHSNHSDDDIHDYGLYLLNKLLNDAGRSLEEWPSMPQLKHDWSMLEQCVNPLFAEQLEYEPRVELGKLNEKLPLLNPEQQSAYELITSSVKDECGSLFFLNGPGGTGKTFLYNCVCNYIQSQSWIVLCVSSSGIAALLIQGGRTAHSMFKIPIDNLSENSFCAIPKESHRADLLHLTQLIIWDEIGAQHRFAPEAVDRTCRDIRNNNKPFGGITVVFGGDFQQTLPVVPRGSKEEIVNATLRKSYLWNDITPLRLHRNMQLEDADHASQEFASWLLDIGHGRNCGPTGDKVSIPDRMVAQSEDDLVNFVYPHVASNPPPSPVYFLDCMILAARNADVSGINDKVLGLMTGKTVTYVSVDHVINEPGADSHYAMNRIPVPTEFLRRVNASGVLPGELNLKVGCPLILLRNLSPQNGLCNGTRMVVTNLGKRVIEVRLIGGDHDGKTAFIPRISLIPSSQSTDLTFSFKRLQFPVRLAFALTINKAQGQSVKYVGLDLRVPVFAHGQLYVGCSRATSPDRIKILLSDHRHGPTSFTSNMVYPEVLLD
ncbi:hypothetical protein NP233_g5793 [Leucocoprinus birnbaumii]|uniref:ATP-dependent DNA helicase n=1 Tax=Leucocoprinus birnbaumii TaxID=56174 RepID=A0AAD5YU95_9AGAR|nr:hypothetical protein NP233_g5793 [Leucocoprinus birnbaumii]